MTTPAEAMAVAVSRHNTAETSVIQRLAEQQQIIDELRRQLREARNRITDLELLPLSAAERGQGGEVNPRPAVTIADYCRANGLTYMQAYRALRGETKSRKLEGYQDCFRNWWVYTA